MYAQHLLSDFVKIQEGTNLFLTSQKRLRSRTTSVGRGAAAADWAIHSGQQRLQLVKTELHESDDVLRRRSRPPSFVKTQHFDPGSVADVDDTETPHQPCHRAEERLEKGHESFQNKYVVQHRGGKKNVFIFSWLNHKVKRF